MTREAIELARELGVAIVTDANKMMYFEEPVA